MVLGFWMLTVYPDLVPYIIWLDSLCTIPNAHLRFGGKISAVESGRVPETPGAVINCEISGPLGRDEGIPPREIKDRGPPRAGVRDRPEGEPLDPDLEDPVHVPEFAEVLWYT